MAINLASLAKNTIKPPRIIIHGDAGCGKTTFGACADAPVFIQTEDGLGSLDATAFPLATSFTDVMEAIGTLYSEPHEFKTLVVDSLDWLEPLVWKHTCEFWTDKKGDANRLASIEDAGYGKGYVEALGYWRQFFSGITALRDERKMTIVMIAHSEQKRVEDPLLPPYDRAVTTGTRVIHTVGQPAFLAKNRFNLPPVLPLTWADFAKHMPAL